jgi:hypothetical protein
VVGRRDRTREERSNNMSLTGIVETVAVGIMAVSMAVILWTRREKGIGWRVIQFTVVTLSLPIILILSLEKTIPPEVTGTLLGTIVGYFFSNAGRSTRDQGQKQDH